MPSLHFPRRPMKSKPTLENAVDLIRKDPDARLAVAFAAAFAWSMGFALGFVLGEREGARYGGAEPSDDA